MASKSTTIPQQHKPAAEEMVNNLEFDSVKPGNTHLAPPKDRSPSCISSSGDATCSSTKGTEEADQESLMGEQQGFYYPATNYYGYYYPGHDTSSQKLDDQGYYASRDGLEIQYPVMQGENGSLVYYMPGYQPSYVHYNPYSPGATVGIDGQYLNQQSYFLSPMSPQPIASPGYLPTSIPNGSEIMPSYVWDASLQAGEVYQGHGHGGVPSLPGFSPNFSVANHTYAPSKSMPFSKPNNSETKKSLPVLKDIPSVPGFTNDLKRVNKGNVILANTYLPMSKYTASNQGKSGLLYPNSSVNAKPNARGLSGIEKLKTRGKANGIGEFDLLNEQNHGPRTNMTKTVLPCGAEPDGSPVTKGNDTNDSSDAATIRRDQYNVPDFPSKYDHALFFVIKSYSEDDIHKSIKYNVWASTPNGNKRLDSAYQDTQETVGQKGSKCPVFLFFSVNASGQFCGVAEMTGRVDFDKNMDFWQQDKWNGFFPVKWHVIKDVPNPHFRHIILENNDNKPVTNSRDTQEVRFPQGMEILNIFKNYSSKTSILDDFPFYESRQKTMQDKRSRGPTRAPTPRLSHLQKLDGVEQVISDLQPVDLDGKKKRNEFLIPDTAKA